MEIGPVKGWGGNVVYGSKLEVSKGQVFLLRENVLGISAYEDVPCPVLGVNPRGFFPIDGLKRVSFVRMTGKRPSSLGISVGDKVRWSVCIVGGKKYFRVEKE